MDRFYSDPKMPFVECRHTVHSVAFFKPHLHRAFSVGAAEEGEVVFHIEGKDISLSFDELALINPDTIHSCNPLHNSSRSFYMMHLELDWCLKIQQSLWCNDAFIPIDCLTLKDPDTYALYVDTLNCLINPENRLLMKEHMVATLVGTIFARCCSPVVPVSQSPQGVAELKLWLQENLELELTVDGFARERGLNSYTLLRNFRTVYGITPHAFRMNCRIDHGRKLLQKGVDIADAAVQCGFFDQSHFHRYFKAMTSVTPNKYKERKREE